MGYIIPHSKDSLKMLYNAGWTEDRQIDISGWQNSLFNKGIVPSERVHEFMSQYAELNIQSPIYKETQIQFKLIDANLMNSSIRWFGELTGIEVILIGNIDSETELFMSRDGSIFEYTQADIMRLTTPEENPIEVLMTNRVALEVFNMEEKRWMSYEQYMEWL